MPRTARASQANYCYHVTNRGNARARVFHKDADYAAFVELIPLACRATPMRVLAYCLMPNHFHLVLWPKGDGDLSIWMARLMNLHVRRHQAHHHSTGHIWQGRFKASPIQDDDHLRLVLRHVERNPLRAALVAHAGDWPWSSLRHLDAPPPWLDPGPAPRGPGWAAEVDRIAPDDDDLPRLRRSLRRGAPFGSDAWAAPLRRRPRPPVHPPAPRPAPQGSSPRPR